MKHNYRLTFMYDGGRYQGWQSQKGRLTIEGTMEEVIEKILGVEKVKLIASGRTDAGVHAYGQVANFHLWDKDKIQDLEEFRECLNLKLPEDIRVICVEEVAEGFHSRYDAVGKTYCYKIDTGERPGVFSRRYAYGFCEKLNLEEMKRAIPYLLGKKDFRAFSSEKRKDKDTVRWLKEIVIEEKNSMIYIFFKGEGFLYHMVRILTGTLIEIGTEKKRVEELPDIFESKNRFRAGFMAPAHGLFLVEVEYAMEHRL